MPLVEEFAATYDRARTRAAYSVDLRAVAGTRSVDRHTVVDVFSAARIRSHFERLLNEGCHESKINRRRAALSAFLKWVQRREIAHLGTSISELGRVRAGRTTDWQPRGVLSASDIGLIEEAAQTSHRSGTRDAAIIRTIYECSLRRSELVRMNVEHLKVLRDDLAYVDIPKKSGRNCEQSPLYLTLSTHARDAIHSVIDFYRLKEGPLWRSLSNNSIDRRLSARSVHSIIERVSKAAGFSEINADTIRYSGLLHLLKDAHEIHGPDAIVTPVDWWTLVGPSGQAENL